MTPISIYENINSEKVIEHIELEYFTFFSQDLYKRGEVAKTFYEDGKICCIDTDGDKEPNII